MIKLDEWHDISHEQDRIYTFPNGETVLVARPQKLLVSSSGHRIVEDGGIGHYIPTGWIHIRWEGDFVV